MTFFQLPDEATGTINPQISVSKAALAACCQEHDIRRLAVFGSVLRNDFGLDSDIDLPTEFEPDCIAGLLGPAEMELTLSELFAGAKSICERPRISVPTSVRMSWTEPKFDMLEAAREAISFACGRVRGDLETDRPVAPIAGQRYQDCQVATQQAPIRVAS